MPLYDNISQINMRHISAFETKFVTPLTAIYLVGFRRISLVHTECKNGLLFQIWQVDLFIEQAHFYLPTQLHKSRLRNT